MSQKRTIYNHGQNGKSDKSLIHGGVGTLGSNGVLGHVMTESNLLEEFDESYS